MPELLTDAPRFRLIADGKQVLALDCSDSVDEEIFFDAKNTLPFKIIVDTHFSHAF